MVPIITREGIEAFRAMPVTVALRKMHVYEVRPCSDKRGIDLISDVLPLGRASSLSRIQVRADP
jgi:hypothetical protein